MIMDALMTIGGRRVEITYDGPPVDTAAVARSLANMLIGGDPAGYIRKLAEQSANKKAPGEVAASTMGHT